MKNLFFKNLNHLIIRIFWMVKNWTYSHMSIWIANFVFLSKILFQKTYFLKVLNGGIIPFDFMGFFFKTSKSKKDINYIKYQFSHRFGKVYKLLNMYYSNIKILLFKSNNHVHLNHFKESYMDLWGV